MAKDRKKEEKPKNVEVVIKNARIINASLFEKDQYNDGTPSYKIEVAIPKDDKEFEKVIFKVEDVLAEADPDFVVDKQMLNIDGGEYVSGILDGDKLAKKREKNGKQGDAYKDHWVVRANTIYNKDGQDAPGGIQVFDEDVEPITAVNKGQVYNGCYADVACTIATYKDDETGNKAAKFYLGAVQKTGDGERLASSKDYGAVFGKRNSGGGERRSRRG